MLRHPLIVWFLVALQMICGAYFLWEILASVLGLPVIPLRWEQREIVEIGATLGLILGSLMGVALAITARREMQRAKTAQRLTAGQFTDVVREYFAKLGLTPAETEVAWYILKGMSVSEIAQLRNTREGTVKTQGTAIYKKAGVNGKSQLMALLVEDLLL
ncbi:helix-turn-helix transcriptional regulator [Profundibacter amoris]|uniref:Helix-turn-helix transcriptional regulator n=1 Tax=Profundibacter amoris TaxID=2171755 RepID=A0A347UGY2_9RHOB|nr:LuxR C-terminal-related transcriptional regulator [Profundibacter amoris]AXX98110.1 helix-turn-helix transcriptional regulator [Profundibacter amoris]